MVDCDNCIVGMDNCFATAEGEITCDEAKAIYNKIYHQSIACAESNQIVDDLIELGYPHNFQHERSDIVEYMHAVTDIIRKAYKIKEHMNESS